MTDPRLRIQAGVLSWQSDYPAASNFLAMFFGCRAPGAASSLNGAQFCDAGIDGQITRAVGLEATDPSIANSLWSRIDRELVDRAPVVPLVNPRQVDFLARRVGDYQYSPQWGVLLGQLWVR
jgi:peptide/nickel transport system substrate-binding protein